MSTPTSHFGFAPGGPPWWSVEHCLTRTMFARSSAAMGLGEIDQCFVVVERDDAHLIRREPERESARVMLAG